MHHHRYKKFEKDILFQVPELDVIHDSFVFETRIASQHNTGTGGHKNYSVRVVPGINFDITDFALLHLMFTAMYSRQQYI
jgi:hypothetical protein